MRALLLLLVLVPLPAFAQSAEDNVRLEPPGPRQGYYIGGGARFGVLSASSDEIEDIGTFTGGGFALRFGEMVFPWLGFGGVTHGYFGSTEGFSTSAFSLSMEGQVAPFRSADVAFRLGVGPFLQNVTRDDPALVRESEPDQAFGAIITTGVNWDLFPFRKKDSLRSGDFATSLYAEGQLMIGEDFTSVGATVGLEFTGFFGLAKNKLDLPLEEAYER